jgi:DNA-binding response OmpR family regulator
MKTVLIIDDEPEFLKILAYLFERLSYHVIPRTAAVPLETIRETAPDLLVLDHHLPRKNGSNLCKELKVNVETQQLPVLMLSADERLPEIAKESFADAYLSKPFETKALQETVKRLETLVAS